MNDEPQIEDDQIKALQVVRTILGTTVDPARIVLCYTKHYDTILLDGNSWKTICRLYFKENKIIGILNTRRVETKTRISSMDDIKAFAVDMKSLVKKYG